MVLVPELCSLSASGRDTCLGDRGQPSSRMSRARPLHGAAGGPRLGLAPSTVSTQEAATKEGRGGRGDGPQGLAPIGHLPQRDPGWPAAGETDGGRRAPTPTSLPRAMASSTHGCCWLGCAPPSFPADTKCFSSSATCFRSSNTSRCTWSSSWGSSRRTVSTSRGPCSTWGPRRGTVRREGASHDRAGAGCGARAAGRGQRRGWKRQESQTGIACAGLHSGSPCAHARAPHTAPPVPHAVGPALWQSPGLAQGRLQSPPRERGQRPGGKRPLEKGISPGVGGLGYERAAGDWGADTRQRWTGGPGAAGWP